MKVKSIVLSLVVLLAGYACNKDDNPLNKGGEAITVSLQPAMIEITQGADVPMTRSASVDSIVYAVQVYENDSAYYYGLFNDVTKMQLALTTGNTYKFKVAACQVGTGQGLKTTIANGVKTYYLPNAVVLANQFVKGNLLNAINKVSSLRLAGQTGVSDYPEIDAFYCEKSLQVQKGLASIDIPLKRMGYGVTYSVDGLTSGKLYITMGKDSIVLDKTKTSCRTIRSFYSGSGDYSTFYTKADTLSQSIPVNIKWVGDNGTVVTSQGAVIFKRNYNKTVNVLLNTSGLNLSFEGWSNAVTDIDGNVYHTVTIGTQTWMVENLKVTHYRNGDAIPNVTDATQWANLNTGAWCDYSNISANGVIYGHLYNWYAAVDSRNIAPTGWHVPSDAEWTTLVNYVSAHLGASISVAKALASTTDWATDTGYGNIGNNLSINNSSGFNALSGGNHFGDGFWSSTQYDTNTAWNRALNYNYSTVGRGNNLKQIGWFVRCVKD